VESYNRLSFRCGHDGSRCVIATFKGRKAKPKPADRLKDLLDRNAALKRRNDELSERAKDIEARRAIIARRKK
jgi:hypothetical protein